MPRKKTTPTPAEDRVWGTLDDGAKRWRVSKNTVRRWIADGKITAYRFAPQTIRLDLAEADAQLARRIPNARTTKAAG